MQKKILTILFSSSLLLANTVYASGMCIKGYGHNPEEAFQAGIELLKYADVQPGQEGMLENMQLRIFSEGRKKFFAVMVYSANNEKFCGLPERPEVSKKAAETIRPKCNENICSL
jgi:hypothetical protein